MHDVALDLLILLAGIWLVAVTLRPLGLPTVMGELIVGVLVGPAVFGLIQPSEAITLLAEIGIFFLMFHAGVETQPLEFFNALKRSMGVALVWTPAYVLVHLVEFKRVEEPELERRAGITRTRS